MMGILIEILLPFEDFEPRPEQQVIMDKIISKYELNPFKICRCLIWGTPGMGKSFIAKLYSKTLSRVILI